MSTKSEKKSHREQIAEWKAKVAKFEKPNIWRATWQLSTTLGSYVALWALMYWSLSVSWWLTIPLAILAGGILIRVFIIFHDCGHGSFFKSRRANNFWGFVTGMPHLYAPTNTGAGSIQFITQPPVIWTAEALAMFGP